MHKNNETHANWLKSDENFVSPNAPNAWLKTMHLRMVFKVTMDNANKNAVGSGLLNKELE